ncbi:hypothetical protein Tco_1081442 [Tanacetum coccineum]|uniref:Uncharacterized protein n=1 Tax=Tanacetum coccineum TaxID=301880 RepID=A0ABQ5HXL3_9ASTR
MEANNSINMSDIQRQLYKALVDAYEADKILLDTYGDTVIIKRPRDGADDDQEPSAGIDRGSKRRRSGKEPAFTSVPSETTTTTAGKTTTTDVFEAPAHKEFETGVHDEQAEEEPLPLVPNSQGRHVIPFHHFINNDLEYLCGGEVQRKNPHIRAKSDTVSLHLQLKGISSDVYQKDGLLLSLRRPPQLRIQDIEDMLLLLVQGKVTNLNVEERIAFNVSLRMFTRSVVIQRRVEDLQLGVESYQKKLNLTKPDMYRSNLRRQDAYTPYSDLRGFIYKQRPRKQINAH